MTDTATAGAGAASAGAASAGRGHPLDPVTAAEYASGRQIMAAAGLLPESVRFAYYGLDEPSKGQVLAWAGAQASTSAD